MFIVQKVYVLLTDTRNRLQKFPLLSWPIRHNTGNNVSRPRINIHVNPTLGGTVQWWSLHLVLWVWPLVGLCCVILGQNTFSYTQVWAPMGNLVPDFLFHFSTKFELPNKLQSDEQNMWVSSPFRGAEIMQWWEYLPPSYCMAQVPLWPGAMVGLV